jgi:Predicted secreted protein containing a PDZ domain
MKKVIIFLLEKWKYILLYIVVLSICLVKLPYYIDAPGGLINVGDRIQVENGYKSKGSLNLAYVTEYNATIPMLILSFFNKDWTVNEIGTPEEKKYYDESIVRDKLWMKEAYSNAVILAYRKANKEVMITNEEIYVVHIFKEANSDLKVGDRILSIDNVPINTKNSISNAIKDKNVGDRISIKVVNNKKEYNRYAYLLESNDNKIIGIVPAEIKEYNVKPKIKVHYENSESGPSGGLMIALAIYDALTEEDITGGLTIVGTGTIDLDGNVGEIGGVEYKIKGAVKSKADIFFIPAGENYEEAKKLVEKKKYKIKVVPVNTFDEALDYLKKNVMK